MLPPLGEVPRSGKGGVVGIFELFPFTEQHPLSQPVRAASSPTGEPRSCSFFCLSVHGLGAGFQGGGVVPALVFNEFQRFLQLADLLLHGFSALDEHVIALLQGGVALLHPGDELLDIAREMTSKNTLPCTGCRYCTTHCPQGLNIPWLIELYNEHIYSGGGFIAPMALSALDESQKPTACLGCRSCEQVCPQGIKISEMMADFAEKLK